MWFNDSNYDFGDSPFSTKRGLPDDYSFFRRGFITDRNKKIGSIGGTSEYENNVQDIKRAWTDFHIKKIKRVNLPKIRANHSAAYMRALLLTGLESSDSRKKDLAPIIKQEIEYFYANQKTADEVGYIIAVWKATFYAPFAVNKRATDLVKYDSLLANALYRCVALKMKIKK